MIYPVAHGGSIAPVKTIVCLPVNGGNSGTLTLSGYTGTIMKWQQSTDNGNTWTDISGTAGQTTYSYTNLTHNTMFRALLQSATCVPDSASAIATVYTGVVTTASSVKVCAGNDIYVPVTVTSFTDIDAISLKLLYTTSQLTFVDATYNSAFTSWPLSYFGASGIFSLGGTGNPTDLPDNAVLCTLHFTPTSNFTSGTTNLIWTDPPTHPEYCEYAVPLPLPRYPWDTIVPLCDIPTASYYINDTITVIPTAAVASVSGSTPLCHPATATYTASGVVLGGGTGTWSSSNNLVATVDPNTGLVTTVGGGTCNIIYTITGGCGGTKSAFQALTVTVQQTISGILKYWNNSNTPLGKVTINLYDIASIHNYSILTDTTGTIGDYSLNVCQGTYRITCTTDKPNGGINATDAVQVNSWYVMPYPIERVRAFAGDVVTDNYINSADAGRILQYFLTNGNPSWSPRGLWTFWPANDTLDGSNPLTPSYPENITIVVPGTSLVHNIWGLCTGDFNGSFIPDPLKSLPNTLSLTYGGLLQAKAGDEFDLPLYTQSGIDVGAISLILNFPSDKLEILGIKLADNENSPMMYNVSGDELRIGWYSHENLSLKAGEQLLTLKVKLLGLLDQGETVRFNLTGSPLNELADALGNVIPGDVLNMNLIGSALGNNPVNGSESIKFTNYPNPFTGTTTLAYSLPANGNVTIELRNMLGIFDRVILDNVAQTSGDHKLVLDASDLPDGVYMATLKLTSDGTVTTRTIKIVRTN
jgi:hypothetical protein